MASTMTRLAGCLACLALFAACEGGTGPEREVAVARIEPEDPFPETDSIGAVLTNVAVVVTNSTGGGVGGNTSVALAIDTTGSACTRSKSGKGSAAAC